MPDIRPLAVPCDVVYAYDGSFEGFLCCVYESVYKGEIPFAILNEDAPALLRVRTITSDRAKAERVRASIPAKISPRALELVTTVFSSCLEEKELKILAFLLRGYREGKRLCFQLGDAVMEPLLKAEKHLLGEVHLLKGFVRFADVGGALVATISPKNYILPFIAPHFIARYRGESFLIYDKTHRVALIYREGKAEIVAIEHIDFPVVSEKEAQYQALWKRFYDTIAIESRENPRCRMSHMPKRYWENMLEVSDLAHFAD